MQKLMIVFIVFLVSATSVFAAVIGSIEGKSLGVEAGQSMSSLLLNPELDYARKGFIECENNFRTVLLKCNDYPSGIILRQMFAKKTTITSEETNSELLKVFEDSIQKGIKNCIPVEGSEFYYSAPYSGEFTTEKSKPRLFGLREEKFQESLKVNCTFSCKAWQCKQSENVITGKAINTFANQSRSNEKTDLLPAILSVLVGSAMIASILMVVLKKK